MAVALGTSVLQCTPFVVDAFDQLLSNLRAQLRFLAWHVCSGECMPASFRRRARTRDARVAA